MTDWILYFGIAAGIVSAIAYIPYVIAIFKGNKPNRATWIIWCAVVIIELFSYKEVGAVETLWILRVYAFGSTITMLLALFYGEGGWTRFDKTCLVGALSGLGLWWVFNSPLTALLINIAVDAVGALPTIHKLKRDPSGENKLAWALFCTGSFLNILAIREWTFDIYIYPTTLFAIIAIICTLIFFPRRAAA